VRVSLEGAATGAAADISSIQRGRFAILQAATLQRVESAATGVCCKLCSAVVVKSTGAMAATLRGPGLMRAGARPLPVADQSIGTRSTIASRGRIPAVAASAPVPGRVDASWPEAGPLIPGGLRPSQPKGRPAGVGWDGGSGARCVGGPAAGAAGLGVEARWVPRPAGPEQIADWMRAAVLLQHSLTDQTAHQGGLTGAGDGSPVSGRRGGHGAMPGSGGGARRGNGLLVEKADRDGMARCDGRGDGAVSGSWGSRPRPLLQPSSR